MVKSVCRYQNWKELNSEETVCAIIRFFPTCVYAPWLCYNVLWQVHLSLTWTEPEDPVTVKFLQSDRLVEAAAVNVHGSSITLKLKKQNKTYNTQKAYLSP